LEVFICIGLNGARQSFKDGYLTDFCKKYDKTVFASIRIFDVGENIGKPKMINHMTQSRNDYDFVVSIDSDMIAEDRNWLVKMLIVFGNYNHTKKLGALCSNQSGHNVHMVDSYQVIKKKVKGMTLITSPSNDGVAGGVLMTPLRVWHQLKGYRAFNLYGSDDGHYARDCFRNNYVMAYVDEISFYHPLPNDDGYAKWKSKAVSNRLSDEEIQGFYEDMREK
jgi:hypothetical protein